MDKPLGIYIEHRHLKTNWLYTVPVWKKPYIGSDGIHESKFCPLCQTLHFTKTYHLRLVEGRAIVSKGVLDDLRLAGMPDLDITGTTDNPPPLTVGDGRTRPEQDQTNRSLLVYKKYKPKVYLPKGVPVNASA